MPLRERVRQAIDAPVTEAAALLDEARDAKRRRAAADLPREGKSTSPRPAGGAVEGDEAALAEKARASREKTAAVRRESGGPETSEA